MIGILARAAIFGLLLLPGLAVAEPITLKLAFTTSDQSTVYRASVQPFVEAINGTPDSPIRIETYFSGGLGKDISRHADMVRDGTADIALVLPGFTPARFPDNAVVELPGLFRDIREVTMVFTALTSANALRGYEDFFVIGSYGSAPSTFHSKPPITQLKDIAGKKIRIFNAGDAALIKALGAVPVQMPANQISAALANGNIDATLVPPSILADFGIKRIATYHYMLDAGGAPTALLMNRKKFDSLPASAQELIRKYSGIWPAKHYIAAYEAADRQVIDELKSDSRRKVIVPSASDRSAAAVAFDSVVEAWANEDARNLALLKIARDELAQIRKTQ